MALCLGGETYSTLAIASNAPFQLWHVAGILIMYSARLAATRMLVSQYSIGRVRTLACGGALLL